MESTRNPKRVLAVIGTYAIFYLCCFCCLVVISIALRAWHMSPPPRETVIFVLPALPAAFAVGRSRKRHRRWLSGREYWWVTLGSYAVFVLLWFVPFSLLGSRPVFTSVNAKQRLALEAVAAFAFIAIQYRMLLKRPQEAMGAAATTP